MVRTSWRVGGHFGGMIPQPMGLILGDETDGVFVGGAAQRGDASVLLAVPATGARP